MSFITFFAETAAEPSTDILSILGIDWRLLIVQVIAFLVLLWALSKFVYPWLMKSIDERQKNIEEITNAAKKSEKFAAEAQAETAALLSKARKEASEILANAKQEATDMVNASEAKAKKSAEAIAADAQIRLEKDINKAKRELYDETIRLVAMATEKVIQGTHSKELDEALIKKSIDEAQA